MITVSDIRKALVELLRDKTDIEYITGEDLDQTRNYEDTELNDSEGNEVPTLQVLVEPTNITTGATGILFSKSILVDISYSDGIETPRSEIQDILDKMNEIILPCIHVKDRYFTIDGANCNITDNIGHYVFYIRFTDGIEVKETEPKLSNIEINI